MHGNEDCMMIDMIERIVVDRTFHQYTLIQRLANSNFLAYLTLVVAKDYNNVQLDLARYGKSWFDE